jgi:hypothetical protein
MVANRWLARSWRVPGQEALIECLDLPDGRMKLLGQEHHCRLRHVRQHCAVCLPDPLNEIAAGLLASTRAVSRGRPHRAG